MEVRWRESFAQGPTTQERKVSSLQLGRWPAGLATTRADQTSPAAAPFASGCELGWEEAAKLTSIPETTVAHPVLD